VDSFSFQKEFAISISCLSASSGQTSADADTYIGTFVVFLMMGLVPEWLNLIVVALGRTQLRSFIGAGLFGGAAMGIRRKSLSSKPDEDHDSFVADAQSHRNCRSRSRSRRVWRGGPDFERSVVDQGCRNRS
jgi:hypothetical protein